MREMGPRYRALSHVSMPCSANARVAASDWSRLFHKDMISGLTPTTLSTKKE
jgi:hypothetical protein